MIIMITIMVIMITGAIIIRTEITIRMRMIIIVIYNNNI